MLNIVRYPPINKALLNIHINKILPYSAKKKNTKITAACSVINPLTNSDSASAKSKGARLVSAIEPMKNIMNIGNKGKINQTVFCICIFTLIFKLFVIIITGTIPELTMHS